MCLPLQLPDIYWKKFNGVVFLSPNASTSCNLRPSSVSPRPASGAAIWRRYQGQPPAYCSRVCVIEGQACQECVCAPARLNPEMALLCAHLKEKIVVRLGRLSQTVESAEGESTVLVDPSSTVSRVGD